MEQAPRAVTEREVLDLIGTALASISIGAASGGALVCLVLAAAHGMERGKDQPFTYIALAGAACGLVVSAAVAWNIGRRLGVWRATLTTISAVAGGMLITLLTLPADMAAGRLGLLILAGICIGVMMLALKIFFPKPAAT